MEEQKKIIFAEVHVLPTHTLFSCS